MGQNVKVIEFAIFSIDVLKKRLYAECLAAIICFNFFNVPGKINKEPFLNEHNLKDRNNRKFRPDGRNHNHKAKK